MPVCFLLLTLFLTGYLPWTAVYRAFDSYRGDYKARLLHSCDKIDMDWQFTWLEWYEKRNAGWSVAFLPESAYNKQQAIKANSNRYRKITIPNYRIRRLQWSLTKSCSNTEKRIISPKNSLQSSCSYRGQRTTVKTEMNGFTLALTAARRPAEWVNERPILQSVWPLSFWFWSVPFLKIEIGGKPFWGFLALITL